MSDWTDKWKIILMWLNFKIKTLWYLSHSAMDFVLHLIPISNKRNLNSRVNYWEYRVFLSVYQQALKSHFPINKSQWFSQRSIKKATHTQLWDIKGVCSLIYIPESYTWHPEGPFGPASPVIKPPILCHSPRYIKAKRSLSFPCVHKGDWPSTGDHPPGPEQCFHSDVCMT